MFKVESVWLLLDGSGLSPRAGLWRKNRWLAYRESPVPALEALYGGVQALLQEANLEWSALGGYLYVDGPGSVLGLRLAAMAVRTWQTDDAVRYPGPARPVFACGSLHLAAALALAAKADCPFSVFTESRQGRWHVLGVDERGQLLPAQEVGENAWPAGALFHLPARKAWSKPPPHAQPLPVSLRDYPEIISQPGLFLPSPTATPYALQAPEYKKWEGVKQEAEGSR